MGKRIWDRINNFNTDYTDRDKYGEISMYDVNHQKDSSIDNYLDRLDQGKVGRALYDVTAPPLDFIFDGLDKSKTLPNYPYHHESAAQKAHLSRLYPDGSFTEDPMKYGAKDELPSMNDYYNSVFLPGRRITDKERKEYRQRELKRYGINPKDKEADRKLAEQYRIEAWNKAQPTNDAAWTAGYNSGLSPEVYEILSGSPYKYGGNIRANGGNIGSPAFMAGYDFVRQFDEGGTLRTQGANFSNGMSYINEGGSHEENPLEGVPMGYDNQGTPNVVEEGETIYDDYVYSERLHPSKEFLAQYKIASGPHPSFADVSKKFGKESAERPNDPISRAGLKVQMAALREEQERVKAEIEARKQQAQNDFLMAMGVDPQQAAMESAMMQQGMMQDQAAQQQQMAQEQAQQQAMQEQAMQEEALRQQLAQEQAMQQGGEEVPIDEAGNPVYAYGGRLNKYGLGGKVNKFAGPDGTSNLNNNSNIWQILANVFEDTIKDKTYKSANSNTKLPAEYNGTEPVPEGYNAKTIETNSDYQTFWHWMYNALNGNDNNQKNAAINILKSITQKENSTNNKTSRASAYYDKIFDNNGNLNNDALNLIFGNLDGGWNWDSVKGVIKDGSPGWFHNYVSGLTYDSSNNTWSYTNPNATNTEKYYYRTKDKNGKWQLGNEVTDFTENVDEAGNTWFDAHPGYTLNKKNTYITTDNLGNKTTYYYLDPIDTGASTTTSGVDQDALSKIGAYRPNKYQMVPLWGNLGMVAADVLGLNNKPTYTEANAILGSIAGPRYISANPRETHYTPKLLDSNWQTNLYNAQRASDMRYAADVGGMRNPGAALAGRIVANNKYQKNLGELAQSMIDANNKNRLEQANVGLKNNELVMNELRGAAIANQSAWSDYAKRRLEGTASAMAQRYKERSDTDAAKAQNLSNLYKSYGNIGDTLFNANRVLALYKAGVFNNMQDDTFQGLIAGK